MQAVEDSMAKYRSFFDDRLFPAFCLTIKLFPSQDFSLTQIACQDCFMFFIINSAKITWIKTIWVKWFVDWVDQTIICQHFLWRLIARLRLRLRLVIVRRTFHLHNYFQNNCCCHQLQQIIEYLRLLLQKLAFFLIFFFLFWFILKNKRRL